MRHYGSARTRSKVITLTTAALISSLLTVVAPVEVLIVAGAVWLSSLLWWSLSYLRWQIRILHDLQRSASIAAHDPPVARQPRVLGAAPTPCYASGVLHPLEFPAVAAGGSIPGGEHAQTYARHGRARDRDGRYQD